MRLSSCRVITKAHIFPAGEHEHQCRCRAHSIFQPEQVTGWSSGAAFSIPCRPCRHHTVLALGTEHSPLFYITHGIPANGLSEAPGVLVLRLLLAPLVAPHNANTMMRSSHSFMYCNFHPFIARRTSPTGWGGHTELILLDPSIRVT